MKRALWLMPVVIFLVGCGSGQPSLDTPVPVTGKLQSADGKPFGNVLVYFHPVDASAPASGQVAADGTFTLTTYGNKEGICKGKYVVYVRALQGKEATKTNPAFKGLPEKVRDEATLSPLEVEVKSSGQAIDLKLPTN